MNKKEKFLRINLSREPQTLDPRKIHDPAHKAVARLLYEGLTRLESDLSVSLAQAEAIEISPDRLRYKIYVGPHLWSNHQPVTAVDFVATFLDHLDPGFPSPHSHLLYDIRGAKEAKQGKIPLSDVGIRILSDRVFEIELNHPNPSFLQILACEGLLPVCRAQLSGLDPGAEDVRVPVTNGPCIVERWERQAELVLRKNPRYEGKTGLKFEGIHFTMIDNETTALHMFATGHLDILGAPFSLIPLPYLKDLKEQGSLTVHPVAASMFCAFNTKSPLFNNVSLRKAFACAIDQQEIVAHITNLDEEVTRSPIPSVLKGAKKASTHSKEPDFFEAKKHLQAALLELKLQPKDLETLTLYYWPFELNYRIAQALQQQWLRSLGVKVKIEVVDFKTLMSKVQAESYHFALFAWSADYADPLSLLNRFRYSGDSKNYSHWESAEFSALLDKACQTSEWDQRSDPLRQAEELLMAEVPLAPLFHWNFALLVQPKVRGVEVDPLGNLRFEKISF